MLNNKEYNCSTCPCASRLPWFYWCLPRRSCSWRVGVQLPGGRDAGRGSVGRHQTVRARSSRSSQGLLHLYQLHPLHHGRRRRQLCLALSLWTKHARFGVVFLTHVDLCWQHFFINKFAKTYFQFWVSSVLRSITSLCHKYQLRSVENKRLRWKDGRMDPEEVNFRDYNMYDRMSKPDQMFIKVVMRWWARRTPGDPASFSRALTGYWIGWTLQTKIRSFLLGAGTNRCSCLLPSCVYLVTKLTGHSCKHHIWTRGECEWQEDDTRHEQWPPAICPWRWYPGDCGAADIRSKYILYIILATS